MPERKTIRPITLRRVIEVCSLAVKSKALDTEAVSKRLNLSISRAKEILREVERMKLLTYLDDTYVPNSNTPDFLDDLENKQWNRVHEYFKENYSFYNTFIRLLTDHLNRNEGLSLDALKEESRIRKLSLNETAIEVLTDWCDRLGVVQRHLYSKRVYLVKSEGTDSVTFKDGLRRCYRELTRSYSKKGVFVKIPIIREDTCEQLKITRKVFDTMLRQTFLENIGIIELSGAPIITLAKKSPLSVREIKLEDKQTLLSPKFELAREREGLLVGRKAYYYLAVHGDI